MTRRPGSIARFAITCWFLAATITSATCVQSTSRDDSLEALTIAVKNNPDLELMATDEQAKILTVRVKSADRVITVTPSDLQDGRLVIDAADKSAPSAPAEGSAATSAAPSSGETATAQRAPAQAGQAPPAAEPPAPAPGTEVTASGKGKQATVKTGPGGVSVDAGGRRVAVDSATGGVSVDAEGRSADVRPGAAPAGEPPAPVEPEPPAPVGEPETEPPPAATEPAPSAAAAPSAARRRMSSPIECTGQEALEFDSILLEAGEDAVSAGGDCRVVLTNSEIVGNRYALNVSGNAQVELADSIVRGGRAAMNVSGKAVVSGQGTEFRGGVKTSGAGSFKDLGGNTMH